MILRAMVKQLLNVQLARVGLAVVHESAYLSFERLVAQLNRAGLAPRTVIDIGVAEGTPWLYEAFPDAKYHLVGPTQESLPYMRSWSKKLNAEVHNVALGSEKGTLEIALRSNMKHATLLKDVTNPDIIHKYHVEVVRFDQEIKDVERPTLCKIDVEGAELMVLEGMGRRLEDIDVVVMETSMLSLYERGSEFAEIVKFMSENNFSLHEITDMKRRPYDGALHQIDAVFVPNRSPLRVRRWE